MEHTNITDVPVHMNMAVVVVDVVSVVVLWWFWWRL